jgi:hypothetical protein
MEKVRFVGLDVHKESVTIAVAGSGAMLLRLASGLLRRARAY